MLHKFLDDNRAILVDKCHAMAAARLPQGEISDASNSGISVFVDRLIVSLTIDKSSGVGREQPTDIARVRSDTDLETAARQHGRELLAGGYSLEEVVRDYGDVCQAVTSLAFETGISIEADEYRSFNLCLDNAIASAVTAYAKHDTGSRTHIDALSSSLAPAVHELRNHLHTAMLVVTAIKAGNGPIAGATGAVLDRSLLGMRNIIDHALAEIRVTAQMPPRQQVIPLAKFLANAQLTAAFDAQARGTAFTLDPVAPNLTVYGDPEMLASAVGNLLQNAFKFTKHHQVVRLQAFEVADRVKIEVVDGCGGLALGVAESMFRPFSQNGEDRSGLGLGLDIARRAVEANGGVLSVRNLPGKGCIFTIDMPRYIAV